MSIFLGNSEPSKIFVGGSEVASVRAGDTKVRPTFTPRTFTITWTEQSNMSSGWTYSDDAAGLTAGSGDFDDFFGYSAVLLNTSGVETAEMTQSGGTFTGAMTTLGNIASGDNVMIKFPLRGIKMTKSGSVVTLSITDEPNKAGYQYYAHTNSGTLSSPGTPKSAFYIGAYEGYKNSNVLKSWSGRTPQASQTQATFCTQAKNNGTGYNIFGYYQWSYINALYMMKYGNPNSTSRIGAGCSTNGKTTGGTNSQTSATYGTTSTNDQIKLFGIEDRWGNLRDFVGGVYALYENGGRQLYTILSGWSGDITGGEYTGTAISLGSGNNLSSIAGNNKAMFATTSTVYNASYNTYYSSYAEVYYNSLAVCGDIGILAGALSNRLSQGVSTSNAYSGARLMYL